MRKGLVIVLALGIAAGAAAWFEPTGTVRGKLRGEAFFADRPTSYWQKKLDSDSPADQEETPRRLQDSQAVPVLIELTSSRSPSVRVQAAGLLAKIDRTAALAGTDALLTLLADPDRSVRLMAARALGALHPDDPRVVPALIAKLDGPDKVACLRASPITFWMPARPCRNCVPCWSPTPTRKCAGTWSGRWARSARMRSRPFRC